MRYWKPYIFVRPSAARGWFSCGYGSHVCECDIGSPTYFVWPSAARGWRSYDNDNNNNNNNNDDNTYMISSSCTVYVGLAQARPNYVMMTVFMYWSSVVYTAGDIEKNVHFYSVLPIMSCQWCMSLRKNLWDSCRANSFWETSYAENKFGGRGHDRNI